MQIYFGDEKKVILSLLFSKLLSASGASRLRKAILQELKKPIIMNKRKCHQRDSHPHLIECQDSSSEAFVIPDFASCRRRFFSSRTCFASSCGNSSFKSFNDSQTICEIMSREFSLSSAGTTNHGACSVLVAVRQSS